MAPPSAAPPSASTDVPSTVTRAFVWTAAAAIAVFVVVQVWANLSASAGDGRLRQLMPQIGADLVDAPLSAAQGGTVLERSPSDGGGTLTLAELPDDAVIFVNFWATWCKPCRDELPSMFRLRRELAGQPFIMVAISYDDDWPTIIDFFQQFVGRQPREHELLVLRDPAQNEAQMLRTHFGTSKLPDSYLLRDGRILARFVNAREWTDPAMVEFFKRLTGGG